MKMEEKTTSHDLTFKMEDLTQEFYDRVIYVLYFPSSGMGGEGSLIMMTDDGEEYQLSVEIFERGDWDLPKYVPLLKKFKDAEANGWKKISGNLIMTDEYIRTDYYDLFQKEWKTGKYRCLLDDLERIFHTEEKPRHLEEETAKIRKKEEDDRKAEEEHRERVRLTEEDYTWKEIYANNLTDNVSFGSEGCYLLLFRHEDGKIMGNKWTIWYQQEEFEPMGHKAGAPTERYNLFYRRYDDMAGILKYREPNDCGKWGYSYSTLQDGMYDKGKFVRSFQTLEEAKHHALRRNEAIGWGMVDKENIVRFDWSEAGIAKMVKEYVIQQKRENQLRYLFYEHRQEIYEVLAEHDTRDAVRILAEKYSITGEETWELLQFKPDMFTKKKICQFRDAAKREYPGDIILPYLEMRMRESQITFLGGRPGSGKTKLALQLAEYFSVVDRKEVLYFSPAQKSEKLKEIVNLPEAGGVVIDDTPSIKITDIINRCREKWWKGSGGLDVVIIDGIDFVEDEEQRPFGQGAMRPILDKLKEMTEMFIGLSGKEWPFFMIVLAECPESSPDLGNRITMQDVEMEYGDITEHTDLQILLWKNRVEDENSNIRISGKHTRGMLEGTYCFDTM